MENHKVFLYCRGIYVIAIHKLLQKPYFINLSFVDRFSLKIATVDGLLIRLPSDVDLFLRDLESSRFLPCNFKRAQKFYSKYGDDRSDAANAFRKRGKDVLQIAKIILDNLGVRFWLSSGTCLGKDTSRKSEKAKKVHQNNNSETIV